MSIGNDDLAPLVGSWRLLTAEVRFLDTGEHLETYGPNPEGRMVFSSVGRIMFIIAKSGRQSPTNDAERVTLFNDFGAYTVRWPRKTGQVVKRASHP